MKKNQKIIMIIVLLFTIVMTAWGSVMVQLSIGTKRLVNASDWEELNKIRLKYKNVEDVERYIRSNYYKSTDDIDFKESQIKGLFSKLDPYSSFLDADMYKDLMEVSSGEFVGVGIQIRTDDMGYTEIESPIPDTPGERAGLRSGDKIYEVDGVNIIGKNLYEVVKMIKGEPQTTVKFKLFRGDEELEFSIVRDVISVSSVDSQMLDGGIGYIQIKSFTEHVAQEFKEHYEALSSKHNPRGLVIDLRNNPGGALDQCEMVADYILGEQVIVTTKDGKGNIEEAKSDAKKIEIPYIVLINQGSASASEILAGAIKDTESAKLVGEKSFGKGLVQSIVPWGKDTAIKLTIAQYFTPNGNYIHGTGIEPDIKVELSKDYNRDDMSTDNQLQTALEELKKQLK